MICKCYDVIIIVLPLLIDYLLYLTDDGDGSFDDDFDKIGNSVSAFYLDPLWFGFLVSVCLSFSSCLNIVREKANRMFPMKTDFVISK